MISSNIQGKFFSQHGGIWERSIIDIGNQYWKLEIHDPLSLKRSLRKRKRKEEVLKKNNFFNNSRYISYLSYLRRSGNKPLLLSVSGKF
jgi:hypothetical protein